MFSLYGVELDESLRNAIVVVLTAIGGYIVKPGTGTRRK